MAGSGRRALIVPQQIGAWTATSRRTSDTCAMNAIPYRVVESWTATYDNPVFLRAGDSVAVGRRDEEWPGFVWCTTEAGAGGWVPAELLESSGPGLAIAATAYDTRELTVKEGESVVGSLSMAGWTWCESSDHRTGWVPDRCLVP